ncbi:serine hydrolase domain-containing protein [Ekhidna sp.]|uniref:serine hydrolase domain-containing protein n=1 Tax=Ekhidna sp. TaxID=2608089 RepID=UPI003B5A76B3
MSLALAAVSQENNSTTRPQDIKELRQAILQVLEEANTPGAGIALVDSSGPIWIEGLGLANREKQTVATDETMFRIGSTSKIFIALAVLKLQEEGRLHLNDKVRELAPEIEFTNPWEDTNPIVIAHLLEHTTGWDDLHPSEFAHNESDPLALKEGLDFHPHSRISKWVPGTRMAYCNSGPNVAAYIVEKITGQTFEAYVQQQFFNPMQMETMTYFPSEDYIENGATLYEGPVAQDYWHLITRPSGAINASPRDMAKVVQFFIERGKVDSMQLVNEASINRMETPSTTLGAKAGLPFGYGLCLYTSDHYGFTYFKHGGGVNGGVSDFSYLPSHGLGYSVQINSGSGTAIQKIAQLIRNFQTKDLTTALTEIKPAKPTSTQNISGYYQSINPRKMLPSTLPPLMARKVWLNGDTLVMQTPAHIGDIEKYIPVKDNAYQSAKSRQPNLVIVNDPLAGEAIEIAVPGGTQTLGSVSPIVFYGRLVVLILWILMSIRAFILAPFWLFKYWKSKIPGGANIQIRLWPLVAIFFLIIAFLFAAVGNKINPNLLAEPSFVSLSITIVTILFFLFTMYSLALIIKASKLDLKRSVYFPSTLFVALQSTVAIYLLWHGVIGIRIWI